MKYKSFKKCKNYKDIYTKEKETKELQIELDGVSILVAEHQYGMPINEPYVEIRIKGCTHCMSLSTFIKKIRA